jgi:hypothetical protein
MKPFLLVNGVIQIMDVQNQNQPMSADNTNSMASAVSTNKKLPWKMIIGGVVLVLLLVGGIAGYFLTQTSQDVRQQAASDTYTAQELCIISKFNGDKDQYNKVSSQCGARGLVWNDIACDCLAPEPSPVVKCFTTKDDCADATPEHCTAQPSFINENECLASLSSTQACYTTVDDCASGTPSNCSLSPNFETRDKCLASLGGGTGGDGTAVVGTECRESADCKTGANLYCNTTTGTCAKLYQTVGDSCNPNAAPMSDGNAGEACCVGGTQECKSGACSGNGDGTIGTCLAGVGGPSTSPTQDSCIDQGYDFRCGDCGGFCGNYADGTCKEQAYDLLSQGQCDEGVQNGGSCAIGGYNNSTNSCEVYCTNILGKDGDDCGVGRTCKYIGPENSEYSSRCPEGNGFSSFGWDGQCFNDIPAGYIANTYYCECPNGDCTGVSLGNGCQLAGQSGACFQGGTCGVLQVDLDSENPPAGSPNHTSRNKMVTSGCNVQPPAPSTPPDIIVNPPTTPPTTPPTSYFCNSTCSTDAQCQTADGSFVCSSEQGNRCRLSSNPTSSECQPAVGPMCLSLSLTNISNPSAGATDDPELGDAVNFTCGLVDGASRYIFRVIEPDDTIVDLAATGATSAQYTISKDGMHYAQCQICTGADDSTCHAYEDPFN